MNPTIVLSRVKKKGKKKEIVTEIVSFLSLDFAIYFRKEKYSSQKIKQNVEKKQRKIFIIKKSTNRKMKDQRFSNYPKIVILYCAKISLDVCIIISYGGTTRLFPFAPIFRNTFRRVLSSRHSPGLRVGRRTYNFVNRIISRDYRPHVQFARDFTILYLKHRGNFPFVGA